MRRLRVLAVALMTMMALVAWAPQAVAASSAPSPLRLAGRIVPAKDAPTTDAPTAVAPITDAPTATEPIAPAEAPEFCTAQWRGTMTDLWTDATKWSTGAVPTASDWVCVPTEGGLTIPAGVDATVRGADLPFATAVRLDGVLTVTGHLSLDSATLTGSGALVLAAGSRSQLSGTANVAVTNLGEMFVDGALDLVGPDGQGYTLTNDGVLRVLNLSGAVPAGGGGGRILNRASGTVSFAMSGTNVYASVVNRGALVVERAVTFHRPVDLAGGATQLVYSGLMPDESTLWTQKGTLTRAGSLHVALALGLTLGLDGRVNLIKADALTGAFKPITLADPTWSLEQDATSVTLLGPTLPKVTPQAPVATDECSWERDMLVIPDVVGVDYYYVNKLLKPGTYIAGALSLVIDAWPQPGYELRGTTQWTFTYTDEPCPASFTDVPTGMQFFDEIEWLARSGISTGWVQPGGAKVYRPLAPVNRDAMAAFLYRLAGEPAYTPPRTSPFVDVTPTTQFYKEICWLAEEGISTGWTVGGRKEFRPVTPIARDAMAVFMYRFAGSPAYTAPSHSYFLDVTPSTQFFTEIMWMADHSVTTGWQVANGYVYRPLDTVKRDAMAAFMYRLNFWVLMT